MERHFLGFLCLRLIHILGQEVVEIYMHLVFCWWREGIACISKIKWRSVSNLLIYVRQ